MVRTLSVRTLAFIGVVTLTVFIAAAAASFAHAANAVVGTYASPGTTQMVQDSNGTASNADVAALLKRLQDLLKQVSDLKAQANNLAHGTVSTSTPWRPSPGVSGGHDGGNCSVIAGSGTTGPGSQGTQVSAVQKYLVEEGDLPASSVTGYYGPQTIKAVQTWQKRNGIVSAGTPGTTGHGAVGKKTRAAMVQACEGNGGPITGGGQVCNEMGSICPVGTHSVTGPSCKRSCEPNATTTPAMCPRIYAPVCGAYVPKVVSSNGGPIAVDGILKTYSNMCMMTADGATFVRNGSCDASTTCLPRPACLDATPRCMLAEPQQGWCPATSPQPIACTMEAKICPDGSSVGRTGPKCEFAACPTTPVKPIACTMDAKICPDGTAVGRTGPNCQFVCPASGTSAIH